MNASVAIQVVPKVDTPNLLRIVDAVISYITSSGLKYEVSAFETTIEGDYDKLMEIVKNCQLICIKEGAPSVMSYVKISYSPNGVLTIGEKVDKHRTNREGAAK